MFTMKFRLRLEICGCFVGILSGHYDSTFNSNHRMCLSILKEFGFGRRVMETRILIEVEEMINKVREMQGRPFDVRQLTTSCVANVIMSMLFGRRFDHSDPRFQQLISDFHDMNAHYSMALDLFPALRFIPYFRRSIARELELYKSIHNFINSNTAACSKVCNCTSLCKISAFSRSELRDAKQQKVHCIQRQISYKLYGDYTD